jgi:poly(A) polymerase
VQIPDVPPQLLSALVEAAAGQRLALVGGVVRDLLLHRHHQDPWRGLPDLDLVVEGRAADLVERLPQALEHQIGRPVSIREQHHGRYGTAELELALPPEWGGTWLLDVASARQEVYPRAGANPVVSPGSLEQDLARRDFTVNAMALVLNVPGAGVGAELELLDSFGGQADLAERQLRFLHPDSLRDDPTRLVRAARYAARLGFALAPEALQQASSTLRDWPWDWSVGDDPTEAPPALATRLRMELELLLQRESCEKALASFQSWGGFYLFDAKLQHDQLWKRRLHWARRFAAPLIPALLEGGINPVATCLRLGIAQNQIRSLSQAHGFVQKMSKCKQASDQMPSYWCNLIEESHLTVDTVALLLSIGFKPRHPLLRWLAKWRFVKSPVTSSQLILEGWKSGYELGRELRRRRFQAIDSDSTCS